MNIPKPGREKVLLEKFGKRVVDQEFTMPNGTSLDYLFFQFHNNPVMVLPITGEGSVVALKQFRFGANDVVVEIPGGCPSGEGETPEAVAMKELEEETGYRCERLVKLSDKVWFEPANFRTHFSSFLALGCRDGGKRKPDDAEVIEVFKVPLERWVDMVMSGEVTDLKTVATTFSALPHLGYKISKVKG